MMLLHSVIGNRYGWCRGGSIRIAPVGQSKRRLYIVPWSIAAKGSICQCDGWGKASFIRGNLLDTIIELFSFPYRCHHWNCHG